MKRQHLIIFALLICFVILVVDPVYAPPAGAIAHAITTTFWGKVPMILALIIFAPLIIYVSLREFIGVKITRNALKKIARVDRRFNWLDLEKDIRNVYSRVHIAWDKEDMSAVQEYVSSWYWQNQQLVYLDEWKSRNLHNVCHLKSIGRIKPLYLELTDGKWLLDDIRDGSLSMAFAKMKNSLPENFPALVDNQMAKRKA